MSGLPTATGVSLLEYECSPMKAPAAIGLNPSSMTRSLNSKRASSYALFPYTTTMTAGVAFPLSCRNLEITSTGSRPAYTGDPMIANSSCISTSSCIPAGVNVKSTCSTGTI